MPVLSVIVGPAPAGAELNYLVHEKELLAVKEALRTWERYIDDGKTTTVIIIHEGLQYLDLNKGR